MGCAALLSVAEVGVRTGVLSSDPQLLGKKCVLKAHLEDGSIRGLPVLSGYRGVGALPGSGQLKDEARPDSAQSHVTG